MLFITPIGQRLSDFFANNRFLRINTSPCVSSTIAPSLTMSSKRRKSNKEELQPVTNAEKTITIVGQKRKAKDIEEMQGDEAMREDDRPPPKFVRSRGYTIAATETREREYSATLVSMSAEHDHFYTFGVAVRGHEGERWTGVCHIPMQQMTHMDPAVVSAFKQFEEERNASNGNSQDSDDDVIVVKHRLMRLCTVPGRTRFLQLKGIVVVDEVLGPLSDHPTLFSCSLRFRKFGEDDWWKGDCQIPKDEIQEWKLVDWEGELDGLPSTETFDEATLAELDRLATMRTVEFYGQLARNAFLRVDLYERDGEEWSQYVAEILEMHKKGEVLSLRFRVEVEDRTWLHLYGTMNAGMKHGRFAEESSY